MDPHDGSKFNPMYTKPPHDFPTWRSLNQPLCLSAEHANLHELHASSPLYLPQLMSLHAPVSFQSLLMHPHDVLATKPQIGVSDPEIRSVIHPTFVRQFNEAHGFPTLPAGSFRELLRETRSNLDCLQQCDAVGLMSGGTQHHHVDGLSTHYGAANQVGDLNGSMFRGNMNMENIGDQIQRSVDNDIDIAARSLSMMTNSNTAPARLSPTYPNNTGMNNQGLIDATVQGMGLIKVQTGINDGNTTNKDAVAHHLHEKRFNARSSSTICFGQAPPLDVDTILEQPVSLNPKRRLSSSIITTLKRAQLECMSYPSSGTMWDNNSGYNSMQPASRPKKSSRHPLGPALNTNLRPRARQGSANDPQSIAARQRRERINTRLKALQELVPNGSKVDLVTMLEKAINYVKFLQLQLKVLKDDEFWSDPQNLVGYNSNDIDDTKNDKEEYSTPKSSNGVS